MKTPVVVDIETSGTPHNGELLVVGYQEVGEPRAHILPGFMLDNNDEGTRLKAMLADPERPIVEMTKYDARWERLQGNEVAGPIYDIQVMAWVLNENQSLSLESIARRYCGITMDKRLSRSGGVVWFRCDDGKKVPIAEAPEDQLWAYCARDVEAETSVFQELLGRLDATEWLDYFLDEEVPFTSVLLDMECAGLPIDLVATDALREVLEVRHADMATALLQNGSLPEGFNINSGSQLAEYLFKPLMYLKAKLPMAMDPLPSDKDFEVTKVGRLYIDGRWKLPGRNLTPGRRTDKGDRTSTSSPALLTNMSTAADPWVHDLLAYRKVDKALTTYLRKFPKIAVEAGVAAEASSGAPMGDAEPKVPASTSVVGEGAARGSDSVSDLVVPFDSAFPTTRIFGRFNQTGTKTGRLSSSEPNLQNIPAHGDLGERIRGLFRGSLVVGDYSQLEPRLMAHFSLDPFLLDVYRGGKDIYRELAARVFGVRVADVSDEQRGIAKVLVLAMGYGAGPSKVAEILTINGYLTATDVATGYLRELQALVHTFFEWRESVIARVKRQGYVQTIGGRHRRLKAAFVDRRNWKNVGYGERQAVNAIVQGSAGDIVRRVMVRGRWQDEQRLLAQVHDELVWEWLALYRPSEEQLAYIRSVGETAHGYQLHVPLVFEPYVCDSWADKGRGIEVPDDLNEESIDYDEEVA